LLLPQQEIAPAIDGTPHRLGRNLSGDGARDGEQQGKTETEND
jgi:hypothetical protein